MPGVTRFSCFRQVPKKNVGGGWGSFRFNLVHLQAFPLPPSASSMCRTPLSPPSEAHGRPPRSPLGEATALYLHTFITPLPPESGILPLFVYKLSCRRTGSCCFNRCKVIFLFFSNVKTRDFVFLQLMSDCTLFTCLRRLGACRRRSKCCTAMSIYHAYIVYCYYLSSTVGLDVTSEASRNSSAFYASLELLTWTPNTHTRTQM